MNAAAIPRLPIRFFSKALNLQVLTEADGKATMMFRK